MAVQQAIKIQQDCYLWQFKKNNLKKLQVLPTPVKNVLEADLRTARGGGGGGEPGCSGGASRQALV